MAQLAATVVVPTHDHGPLLLCSVRSILAQTVADLEVFVMGDGVTPATRDAVETLLREDRRVRFFDHPKGPRLGEHYRHAALAEAKGVIVTYLGDDDLFLPEHVAEVRQALRTADLVGAANIVATTDDKWKVRVMPDLTNPAARARLAQNLRESVSLSRLSHTLAAYRRLPYGWRTTPIGTPTDRYMVMQFVSQADLVLGNSTRPTVLRFPSGGRREWTLEQRREEMERWFARVADPEWRAAFEHEVRDRMVKRTYRAYLNVERLRAKVAKLQRRQSRDRSR